MKKQFHILFILVATLCSFTNNAQKKNPIVASKAEVKLAATGFKFTEGPAVALDGRVYFTDQPNDKIYIWDEKKGLSLYLEGTGRSNGMYFNKQGLLVTCADEKNQLGYFNENKKLIIIHEGYENKHLNGPNDLWIDPQGGIYFTDPYYKRSWWGKDHKEIQDTQAVYYLSPEKEIKQVIKDFQKPNGLIGTPDGKTLYVADIKADKTWKYTMEPDGTLSQKTFFAPHGSDGMTIDHKGNIYLTSDKIWVYNPKGALIKEIETPEKPANICFGGKKRNVLFITARTSVYTLKMKVKGVN
ncbi:SMP-30/gluconolactonase/LRE family protein [Mariniflexile ostreae]|uniref:SMP-30/gluconolactonase/LRE family protein n=1 Tax=Mariniflexile ostreae TaxID=1520892 RepID=A0ABV5FD61_9FLAO